jgi:hypothetical protein
MSIRNQEYERELLDTKYPFVPSATLTNGEVVIPQDLFTDCLFYPAVDDGRLYLSVVEVSHNRVKISIGSDSDDNYCTTEFSLPVTQSKLTVVDRQQRSAGVLLSSSDRLGLLAAWGIGTHTFSRDEAEFCVTCYAVPSGAGVSGIALPTGNVVSGEVWLVGSDGVILTTTTGSTSVVQINVVGDPLFLQKECESTVLFEPINPVRSITVVNGEESFTCVPDAAGNFSLQMNNQLANNTSLRLHTTELGVVIEVAGSSL